MARDPAELEIPIVATLLLHALLAGGLFLAGDCKPELELLAGTGDRDELIDFQPQRTELPDVELPQPEEETEPEEPEPEPETETEPAPSQPPERPAPDRSPPPQERPTAPPRIVESQPAPGPADTNDEAAPTYTLPAQGTGGSIPVPVGKPPPKGPYGSGGKGTSTGGGGPPTSTGTGPPAPISVAAIKRRAKPIGDTDFLSIGENYPPEAKRRGVEGRIKVRLVVDENGRVTSRKLVTRLGYGLDQLALELAKKLRFEPAIDSNDNPVTSIVVWTFNFTLPG